jgi:hypothetical protein
MRLLNPATLPSSLWRRNQQLVLIPPMLANAYANQIRECDLLTLSGSHDPDDPPIGGVTKEETDKHFAQSFDASVARVALAVIDPLSELGDSSNSILRVMAGDRLVLVDAPCGSGAAGLSILCYISDLRRQGVLPRQPLHVSFIGAEISEYARAHAEQMFHKVTEELSKQAIYVQRTFTHWDVCCSFSNTDFIQKIIIATNGKSPCFVIIANFSGFLQKPNKRKEAEPKLEELLRHASRRNGFALWIEPNTNLATKPGGLLKWVSDKARGLWRGIFEQREEAMPPDSHLVSQAKYQRVMDPTSTPRVHAALWRSDFAARR